MTSDDWTLDEDIRRASTLPGKVYSDPHWFALARERARRPHRLLERFLRG